MVVARYPSVWEGNEVATCRYCRIKGHLGTIPSDVGGDRRRHAERCVDVSFDLKNYRSLSGQRVRGRKR